MPGRGEQQSAFQVALNCILSYVPVRRAYAGALLDLGQGEPQRVHLQHMCAPNANRVVLYLQRLLRTPANHPENSPPLNPHPHMLVDESKRFHQPVTIDAWCGTSLWDGTNNIDHVQMPSTCCQAY